MPVSFASLAILAALALLSAPLAQARQITWSFDNLTRIGGMALQVEGAPRVIATPLGRAILFDGRKDALFFDRHPLAGARSFTFEAIFRPDGGAFEQRWFHLQEGAEGAASTTRILFELRSKGDGWYLDAFATGPGYKQTLIFPERTFPTGRWYHVAQTYDGKMYRAYVNGMLQGEAAMTFAPQGAGRSAVGTRINRVDYFHGAIRAARFTDRALPPSRFLKLPRAMMREAVR